MLNFTTSQPDSASFVMEGWTTAQPMPQPQNAKDNALAAERHLSEIVDQIPSNKKRDGQLQLTLAIAESLSKQEVLIAQAGTGTGKTFAYVAGALNQVLTHKKRVIISTNTVTLQTQLVEKDFPHIQQAIKQPFTVELAKGSSRYMCPKRIGQLLNQGEQQEQLEFDEHVDPVHIASAQGELTQMWDAFNDKRFDGDLDLYPALSSKSLQKLVQRERNHCPGARLCKEGHRCPYYLQRDRVAKADIVVTNHALLANTLLAENKLLGELGSQVLVVDEAHHFHQVFREQLHYNIELNDEFKPSVLIEKLHKDFTRAQKNDGNIASWISNSKVQQLCTKANSLLETLELNINSLAHFIALNFTVLRGELTSQFDRGDQWLLGFEDTQPDLSHQLNTIYDDCYAAEQLLSQLGRELFDPLQGKEEALQSKSKNAIIAARNHFDDLVDKIANAQKCLMRFVQHDQLYSTAERVEVGLVRWIVRNEDNTFALHSNVLNVRQQVKTCLLDVFASTVFTSATIKAMNSFEHFLTPLGLSLDGHTHVLDISSPFDYSKVSLSAPITCGDPNHASHSVQIAQQLRMAVRRHKSILVLFSSYEQLRQVYQQCPQQLRNAILCQDTQSTGAMIDSHKQRIDNGQTSILFGVDSLSEGVDLKRHYLTCVMVAKLPFPGLNEPMLAHEKNTLEYYNKNSFNELMLPICCRKLIQSVGRLIRSEEDYGEVILLDSRLHSKNYAPRLLRNLPMTFSG